MPPATPAKTPAHLQNLISLQDALAVSWAARLNPGYKDAHVIASGQPQPNVRALEEADHPRVWAVPAQRGGGGVRWEAESGQAEAESCGRRSQVDGELPGFVAEPPKPGCPGKAGGGDRGGTPACAGPQFSFGAHTRGPPHSDRWAPCICHSFLASGSLKGNSQFSPSALTGPAAKLLL